MGKFEIRPGVQGGVHFVLKAGNGEIIGVSEHYNVMRSCKKGIASVMKNAAIAPTQDSTKQDVEKISNPKFEIFLDKAGEFRFRLKARNGQIILASESYTQYNSCLNGIDSVKNNGDAEIVMAEKE